MNDLSIEDREITLILDDYHFIEERSIHSQLEFLLEHASPNLHLIARGGEKVVFYLTWLLSLLLIPFWSANLPSLILPAQAD